MCLFYKQPFKMNRNINRGFVEKLQRVRNEYEDAQMIIFMTQLQECQVPILA